MRSVVIYKDNVDLFYYGSSKDEILKIFPETIEWELLADSSDSEMGVNSSLLPATCRTVVSPAFEWTGRGSNPRPSDCQPDALPAELPAHINCNVIEITELFTQSNSSLISLYSRGVPLYIKVPSVLPKKAF